MSNERITEKYEIKELLTVGSVGIALGKNTDAPYPYATWNYRGDPQASHIMERIFMTETDAYADYEQRIEREVIYYENRNSTFFELPLHCLTIEPVSGDIINIKLGQSGYYRSNWNRPGERKYNRETVDFANAELGVTKAQEAAMLHGSMFGWNTKSADPKSYDEYGKLKRIAYDEFER